MDEDSYIAGSRAAWRKILDEALRELGRDGPEWTAHRWVVEREEIVSALREALADRAIVLTDNLNLADAIRKYLIDD